MSIFLPFRDQVRGVFYPLLLDFRKSFPFFFFVELSQGSPLSPSRDSRTMSLEQWWIYAGRENWEVLGRRSAPVPLYPPQIPFRFQPSEIFG